MTTAIDTNVIVALWNADTVFSSAAEKALERAYGRGELTIAAPVFAELIAAPGRTEDFVSSFLQENGIAIDWDLNETVWRRAAEVFQAYAERRRQHREAGPRRPLVDFLIGAHALVRGCRLLTLDDRHYRAAFPKSRVEVV